MCAKFVKLHDKAQLVKFSRNIKYLGNLCGEANESFQLNYVLECITIAY